MPRPTLLLLRSLRPVDESRAEHLASRRQLLPRLRPAEPSPADPGTSRRFCRALARRCSGDTRRHGSGSIPAATATTARVVASADGMRSQPRCRPSRRSLNSSTAARRRRAPASSNSVSLGANTDPLGTWVMPVSIGPVLRHGQRPCLLDASTTFMNLPHESGRTQERHRVRLAERHASSGNDRSRKS